MDYRKIDDLLWKYCLGDTAKIRNQICQLSDRESHARVKRIVKWGIEICHEHLPTWQGRVDLMGGVLSRRECPKCWQALAEQEGVK